MYNITPLVRNIIIINVVVFLLQMYLQNKYPLTEMIALSPIRSPYFKPFQFFTYMFAHGGFGHIFFNMLAFSSFAPILERYWGDKKFLIFYIATGIGAGLIYGVVHYLLPGDDAPMLGASGAIYGILMAFGLLFPDLELMLLFPPIPIKAKYMVFLMGFITYAMDRSGQVAHLAHFGGAFIAFVLITYWRKTGN
jgi:membrane associated rhomboid family serine protease